jgi:class 3 adenylate cyclase
VVNLASRVQELTKEIGAAILVTNDTAARLGPEFILGKRVVCTVRGKTQPVSVVEVLPATSS